MVGRRRTRRVLPILLAAALTACGADEPAPGPDSPPLERNGDRKAATWRAIVAAEAAREARLRRTIRRLRRETTVAAALRVALLGGRITPATHARLKREYAHAKSTAGRLPAPRAAELTTVVTVVERLAAEHRLSASRLRPAFLILRRNARFWARAPAMPAPGQRTSDGPVVFQYYPGRGLQLHPLASWGRANWLAGACLRGTCNERRLRSTLTALTALGSHRGGFLAWEHQFDWGGGTAPWISGMAQATAVSALARGATALGERRFLRAARRALGAFRAPPPIGVAAGDHFLMYSFAPDLRIYNGELQAVSGIGELAALTGDRAARRLFRRGERGVRRALDRLDTGAWSLYSEAGRESTLDYHRLVGGFLGDMCRRTQRRAYCGAHARFARYEHEPTRIGVAPLRRLLAKRTTPVRFSLSKVSSVRLRVWGAHGLALSRDLELPHGAHEVPWTPLRRGRYRLRIAAQGPSGPLGVARRTIRIVDPKPKKKRRSRNDRDRRTQRDERRVSRSTER